MAVCAALAFGMGDKANEITQADVDIQNKLSDASTQDITPKSVEDFFDEFKDEFAKARTETSTINSTAIQWKNWQTAYQNLKSWLGPNSSLREKFWLHLVHLRWHISFLRSKRRAKP